MAGRSPYCHVTLHFLPLAGHNLLLAYYQLEDIYLVLYYTWVQMLLQMGLLLHVGPNVTTDWTFITLGSKCYYRWDLFYAWVQMLLQMGPLLHLGPVITQKCTTHYVDVKVMHIKTNMTKTLELE